MNRNSYSSIVSQLQKHVPTTLWKDTQKHKHIDDVLKLLCVLCVLDDGAKMQKKNPTQNANSYLINIQFIDESKSVHKLRNTQHTLTWNTFPHSLHLSIQYIHNTHSHRDELDSSCQRTKHMECQRTLRHCSAQQMN